jgi:hypothetical protein
VFTSCTSLSYSAKGFNKYRVRTMSYIESSDSIGLVKERNILMYSDSLSKISHNTVDSLLVKDKLKYKLTEKVSVDEGYSDSIKNSIFKVNNLFAASHKRDTIKMDEELQKFIQKSSNEYVLMLVIKGFKRTDANYNQKLAKTVGISILTLGRTVPVWAKSASIISMLIADKRTNRIVYFDQVVSGDPLNIKDMESGVGILISSFQE